MPTNRDRAATTAPSEPPPTPSFIRPALALLAGLGIFVLVYALPIVFVTLLLLRGVSNPAAYQPPTEFRLFTLVLGALAGAVSGFAVARMTVGRSWYTLLLLALVFCVSPLAEARKAAVAGKSYYFLIALAVVAPVSALLGGWLERRRVSSAVVPG
jgi:hypothetical protein